MAMVSHRRDTVLDVGGGLTALNTLGNVNARHGNEPGVAFYTHVSDQFGPFHTKGHRGDRFRGPTRARRTAPARHRAAHH